MSEYHVQEEIIPEQKALVIQMLDMGIDREAVLMAGCCMKTQKMITQFRKWLENQDKIPSQFETMSEVERILKENE